MRQNTRPDQLTERHRPRTLADIVGQGYAVHTLQQFASNPYPHALLFSGPTGVGKTTAALALAAELGAHPTSNVFQVASASCDVETLDYIERELRYVPFGGKWRVILIDEADTMSAQAYRRFLSALENIPPCTVFVWTTNRPEWFQAPERRAVFDRLEHIPFASDGTMLMQDAMALAQRVMMAETGCGGIPPFVADTWVVGGQISFRRVVSSLTEAIRHARDQTAPVEPFSLRAPESQGKRPLLESCGRFGTRPEIPAKLARLTVR